MLQNSCSWKVMAAWKCDAATGIGGFGFLLSPLQDMESPAKKRLRTAAKPSILTQPEGKSVGPTKKKVTFDSNLAQCDKEGSSKTVQPVTKGMSLKETADIVVKYLTPFYKGGKFASKVGHSSWPSLAEGELISLGIWGSKKGEIIWIPPFISKLYFVMCCFSDSRCSNSPLPQKGWCVLVPHLLMIVHTFTINPGTFLTPTCGVAAAQVQCWCNFPAVPCKAGCVCPGFSSTAGPAVSAGVCSV